MELNDFEQKGKKIVRRSDVIFLLCLFSSATSFLAINIAANYNYAFLPRPVRLVLYALCIGVFILGFWIGRPRTIALAPSSDASKVISDADGEFVVPLDHAAKELEDETKFNWIGLWIVFGIIGVIAGILYLLKLQNAYFVIILLCFMSIVFIVLDVARIRQVKNRLQLYDGSAMPVLKLDTHGITWPDFILSEAPENNKNMEYFIKNKQKNKQNTITISWGNITAWQINEGNYGKGPNYAPYYRLKLKPNTVTSGQNLICIRRDFLKDQEERIIDFAQRHLSNPVQYVAQ